MGDLVSNPKFRKPDQKLSESLHWLAQAAADVPEGDDWLSEGERRLIDGMRFPKRRRDWRLGRWTAKLAVCAYLLKEDLILPSLEIRAAVDGAPEAFCGGRSINVSLSVSHSRDMGFCVVASSALAIGCDLEFIEPRDEGFVKDCFTPEEIVFSKQVRADQWALAVNLIWSAKETALKILREGLRRDTRSVSVCADFGVTQKSWNMWTARCQDSSRIYYGWWRNAGGYVYTLGASRSTSAPEPLAAYKFV